MARALSRDRYRRRTYRMSSSQRCWAPAVNGEGQTGGALPMVTAPLSCDTRYPLCAPELTAFSRCGGGRMVDLAHGLPGHVTARPELGGLPEVTAPRRSDPRARALNA